MKTFKLTIIVGLLCVSLAAAAQQRALIPVPNHVEWGSGQYLLPRSATISCQNASLRPAAQYLAGLLSRATGHKLGQTKRGGTIRLALQTGGKTGAYRLSVGREGVQISGCGYAGVVNGIATLRQLFDDAVELKTPSAGRKWTLPYVEIADEPRFEWRGMELDCSRHFFTKQEVMELLDVLALYKINKFHWHLTDDQGWRIEIKKYPLLTQNGGWRTYNNQDSICMRRAKAEDNPDMVVDKTKTRTDSQGRTLYGGYYTQQDIREVVAYAGTRGIEVIPEIDMPGHSLAAINNYEGLSCFPQTGWGKLFTTPLCPGKDKMLDFCKDVWREVFGLFPSKYVHIGGDEVDMTNWKKCPDCQRRMRENGLQTEAQLQAWFLHQMENFFTSNGREMIGWDEIIEGGLSATATVMWWRTWAPRAMKQTTGHGNHVICTPNAQFYLDYDEDKNSIANIYRFNPQPADLTEAERQLVLGVQGNLWTEQVPTRERMFHMAFPRMLAVAELGWSKPQSMSLDDFRRRLATHFGRLRQLGVTYRIPDLTGFYNTNVFTDRALVKIGCLDPAAVIRYTTDGTLPQADSKRYEGPFEITESTDFTFRTFGSNGRKGGVVKCRYIKEVLSPAVNAQPDRPGLQAVWHDFGGVRCADIDAAKVNGRYEVPEVMIPEGVKGNIGLVLTGYINIPADGIYTFALLSDDGSWLKIDGQMVVDNDGEHSPRELIGQRALKAGMHPINVHYFDHNGGQLRLRVLDAGGKPLSGCFKF